MTSTTTLNPERVRAAVRDAVATVPDPEYPDVSIVDLGLLESIDVDRERSRTTARIGLIPTIFAPDSLACWSAVSIRGWLVPGFCPTMTMSSASSKSSSSTVPLPIPMADDSASPEVS